MDSIELELLISWIGGREYDVSIIRSPFGKGAHRFVLGESSSLLTDVEAGPAEEQREDIRRRDFKRPAAVGRKSPLLQLREQGEELCQLVFAGENRDPFRKCVEQAESTKAWLRLRLNFQRSPAAADWPWEALVLDWEGQFLANRPRVSFERGVGLAAPSKQPLAAADGGLRALIVSASPSDFTPLGVLKEKGRIASAFKQAGVPIKVVGATSRATLDKATASKLPYDLIHVICHGDFENAEGGIWLQGADNEGDRLSSGELPGFLRRASLIFLNACHSGRGARDPFAGLAEALLRSGTAAVVAMRRPISDKGAIQLSAEFYRHLAGGDTVAHSLAKWRESSLRNDPDWAVPVLYLAGEDFALWKPAPTHASGEFKPVPRPPGPKKPWWPWLALCAAIASAALVQWIYPQDDPPPAPPMVLKEDSRCPWIPGLDLPFVYVPAGKFEQGSPKVEAEKPVHPVTLTADFCLGAFELTRGQYAQIVGEPQPAGNDRYYPVEGLTGDEARQLVGTLQARFPEAGFRLPTESEWEYAARAGRPGDEDAPSPANCRGRGDDDPYGGVAAVGSFPPNAWDLYDMKGNVWEWVEDGYAPYSAEPAVDPREPETGDKKVRRGGSYANNAKNCRYSTRAGVQPDREQEAAGLRLARSPVTVQN